jgi:hypothetical protein
VSYYKGGLFIEGKIYVNLSKLLQEKLEEEFRISELGMVSSKDFQIVADRLLSHRGIDVTKNEATRDQIAVVIEFAGDYGDELYAKKED